MAVGPAETARIKKGKGVSPKMDRRSQSAIGSGASGSSNAQGTMVSRRAEEGYLSRIDRMQGPRSAISAQLR